MNSRRHAKIIATLGPASSEVSIIRSFVERGVTIFRLNFSHGRFEEHEQNYQSIRFIAKETGRDIGVIGDLQGPKLRIGTFEKGKVFLKKGQLFQFDQNSKPGNEERVFLPHPELFSMISKETDFLLDDGKMRLRIKQCLPDALIAEVLNDGVLSDRKGLNIPHQLLSIPVLTEKDMRDLQLALNLGVDYIALSFVQTAGDVQQAKDIINGKAKILSKIEKPLALQHLDEIINLSDGILIARGDLGVEVSPEKVPAIQRHIIKRTHAFEKPVIVATQMLESMTQNPTPTRAEASDVAFAVYEGADAVMLSAESASGQYPLESVEMMARLIDETEKDMKKDSSSVFWDHPFKGLL